MKLRWIIVSAMLPLLARAGTVTGVVQTPLTGQTVNNGTVVFSLTQAAQLTSTALIAPVSVSCYTDAAGNVVGQPDPLVPAVLSQNLTSGSASGSYHVQITIVDANSNESNPSPDAFITLTGSGTLIVRAPVIQPPTAIGYDVYVGDTVADETRMASIRGTPGSWPNYNDTIGASGPSNVPTVNGTVCSLLFNDQLVPSYTGYNVSIKNRAGSVVAGYPQKWYLFGGSSGTINVSNGTPLYTGTVQYPAAIVSNPPFNASQQMNGNLNMNGFSILNATFSPAITITPSVVTVPFSSSPTFNASLGFGVTTVFQITLTGNVTSGTLNHLTAGETLIFIIKQDGAGSHTFVPPANLPLATISGTASASNMQAFVVDASGTTVEPLGPMVVN